MNQSKTLTIVVPTYNMEQYLNRCLGSLILPKMLMERLEVLVVNDGSKDRSSEIAHSYEKKYPQTFRVIDKENGNYGSCVNRGLKEATGKYIKILDADDWFDAKNFADYLEVLRTLDVDCVMSDMVKVDEEGNNCGLCNYTLPAKSIFSKSELLKPTEPLWMHCVAYKTETVRKIDYKQTEGISYTDQEWLFLPMAACDTLYYYPIIIYNYLVGRDGQTMNPEVFRRNFHQEIKGLEVMLNEYKNFRSNGISRDYLEKRLFVRSNFVYGVFFLQYKMSCCFELMVNLDKTLEEASPIVYRRMEELSRFGPLRYQFVKKWRNRNYPRSLWLLKLGLVLGEIIKGRKNEISIKDT